MNLVRLGTLLALAFMLITMGGCFAGGGASAGGGIGGTGITAGPVTGFGSIFVNGVEYDTTSAAFNVDNQVGSSQSDLKEGMVVTVHYDLSGMSRTATRVLYEDVVEGPVEFIVPDGLSLVVLGQTVLVDERTIIDDSIPGRLITNLLTGDIVEVSGHVKGPGEIAATFIERKTPPADLELKGIISKHDPGTSRFHIGDLEVNYIAAEIDDMPDRASMLWDGLLVEVEGSALIGGVLTAEEVEPEQLEGVDGDIVEITGFVTEVLAPGDFMLGAVRVQTTASTIFEGGTLDDVMEGVRLEVEGALLNGVLIATEVEFEDAVELESDLASVDLANSTLTLVGLPGVTVFVDSQTEFEGAGSPTSLGDLVLGDHLEVRGRPDSGMANTVIAIQIKRVNRAGAVVPVVLQGPVDSAADPILVILGVTVDTSTMRDNDFLDTNEIPIGRTLFFMAATPGTLVEVDGTLVRPSGPVVWDEAEL